VNLKNIEALFRELTLNPSLGKRGTLGSPFSFQEKVEDAA